jgi:hypothetical protein
LVDDCSPNSTQTATNKIACSRSRGRSVWEEIDEKRIQAVQGCNKAETNDELQHEWYSQVYSLLQDPAIWNKSCYADGHDRKYCLKTGALDWEVAEAVAFLAVHREAGLLGCALVTVVDYFAV